MDKIEKINMVLPKNVYVNEINIGDKSLIEIEQYLDNRVSNILDRTIVVMSNYEEVTQSHEFALRDLGYQSNVDVIKEEISKLLNNDLGIIDKYKNHKFIEENGKQYELNFTIDHDKFIKAIDSFDGSILKKPIDAEQFYDNGHFKVVGGDIGFAFDKERLFRELSEEITNLDSREVNLHLMIVDPEITLEDIKARGLKEKVSTFTTQFNGGNIARSTNIKLAAQNIDGTIIPPGEIFSFNETVGKRTVERGFQEAGVYIRGKVDKDIGGGICQVSTTLYNALLFHDLEIVERSNHSLTVPYVPLSRDAAVDWYSKDLRFRNNTDYYIYINVETSKNTISFNLYSTKNDKEIVLESITISKQEAPIEYQEDKTLKQGVEIVEDAGHTGFKSELIKYVYKDGELLEKVKVSNDRYLTTPKIIKFNKMPSEIDVNTEEIDQDIEEEINEEVNEEI